MILMYGDFLVVGIAAPNLHSLLILGREFGRHGQLQNIKPLSGLPLITNAGQ